jgi:hypothetical protein
MSYGAFDTADPNAHRKGAVSQVQAPQKSWLLLALSPCWGCGPAYTHGNGSDRAPVSAA